MDNNDAAPTAVPLTAPPPQITPPDLDKPFDPDTLPPHLRAKLDRISAIRWRMLAIIERRRTVRLAAEAAAAAQGTEGAEATTDDDTPGYLGGRRR